MTNLESVFRKEVPVRVRPPAPVFARRARLYGCLATHAQLSISSAARLCMRHMLRSLMPCSSSIVTVRNRYWAAEPQ